MSKKKAKKEEEAVDLRKLPRDERPEPTTGQSAPARTISFDELTKYEVKLIQALNAPGSGVRQSRGVADLAKSMRLTPLEVRNTIRRLVPSKWVERVASTINDEGEEVAVRGHYRITESGRKRLAAAVS
jgi:hypothetical protein